MRIEIASQIFSEIYIRTLSSNFDDEGFLYIELVFLHSLTIFDSQCMLFNPLKPSF